MKTVLIILGIWFFISFIHEIATGGENLRAFMDPFKREFRMNKVFRTAVIVVVIIIIKILFF
ncbi:hypothetical protein [Eubacterium sp.]